MALDTLPSAVILDGDGVLWHEKQVHPALTTFMQTLERLRIKWVLATNNARYQADHHVGTFRRFGVECDESHIITSPQVAADLICADVQRAARVCMIGEGGLEAELLARGAVIINDQWKEDAWQEPPTHVVSGFTMNLAYSHLAAAHSAVVDHGAKLLVTNPDRSARNAKGTSFPANGGVMAYLAHTTRSEPVVCGKPERHMFDAALKRMQADSKTTVVIGDTPDTEILGGNRLGLETWMVMTGSTQSLDGIPEAAHPKRQFRDIAEIAAHLSRLG